MLAIILLFKGGARLGYYAAAVFVVLVQGQKRMFAPVFLVLRRILGRNGQ